MQRITVIDYGMGNLHSVSKALEAVAPEAEIMVSNDAHIIDNSDRLVLPGVGAVGDCIQEMHKSGISEQITTYLGNKPMLCICVGMQALMTSSEENGGVTCLGHLPGKVMDFSQHTDFDTSRLKVPHIGWNQVQQSSAHPLWANIDNLARFYFVHSYFVHMTQQHSILGRCRYGVEFDVAVFAPNLLAVQFHPEKSHTDGLQLLSNFLNWNGRC